MEQIYKGADIDVFIDKRAGPQVVFSFSGYRSHEAANPRYGDGFIQRCGASAVFFIAKDDHWWQTPEMLEAVREANIHTAEMTMRYTYGQSMGGFGAVLFAGRLHSFYLATAPQLTVDESRAPLHPVWKQCISKRPVIDDRVPEVLENGRGLLVFDPRDSADRKHASLASAAMGDHRSLIVPFASHHVPRALAEMGVLSEIVGRIFKFEPQDFRSFRHMIRKARLRSPTYLERISRAIDKRAEPLLARRLYAYVASQVMREGSSIAHLPHLAAYLDTYREKQSALIPRAKLRGVERARIANDLEVVSAEQATYRATGKDSQITLRVSDPRSIRRVEVKFYSTVESIATLYVSDAGSGFSQSRAARKKVNIGINVISFEIQGDNIDPVIRLDPTEAPGLIGVIGIDATA